MKFTIITLLFSIMFFPAISLSEDIDSLTKEGYLLVEETRVAGNYEYNGCVATGPLRLANGKIFICTTFGFDYRSFMPKVTIVKKKSGECKILINGKTYSGYMSDGN
jgi:hypothetical protein